MTQDLKNKDFHSADSNYLSTKVDECAKLSQYYSTKAQPTAILSQGKIKLQVYTFILLVITKELSYITGTKNLKKNVMFKHKKNIFYHNKIVFLNMHYNIKNKNYLVTQTNNI